MSTAAGSVRCCGAGGQTAKAAGRSEVLWGSAGIRHPAQGKTQRSSGEGFQLFIVEVNGESSWPQSRSPVCDGEGLSARLKDTGEAVLSPQAPLALGTGEPPAPSAGTSLPTRLGYVGRKAFRIERARSTLKHFPISSRLLK